MFLQLKVNPEHRDFLRFLYWNDGNCSGPIQENRMTVHLCGAVSSPCCVNFALRQVALDNEVEYGADVASIVERDFYVDDGLKSVP